MKKTALLCLVYTLAVVTPLLAGSSRRGTAGATFLTIPVSARQVGMGMTGIADAQGADAILWNPARVAYTEETSVTFTHVDYFADMSLDYIAGVKRIGELGVFGISFEYFTFGDIDVTTELQPNGTGATISPFDLAVGLVYGKQITDRAAFGFNVKMINESMRSVTARGFAVDLGFAFDTGVQGLQFGVAMVNYGPQMKYHGSGLNRQTNLDDFSPNASNNNVAVDASPFELPSSVRMGVSFDPFVGYASGLKFNMEQYVNAFASNNTNFGAEYDLRDALFLRGGYNANNDYDGGMTFGGGLRGSMSGLDCSFDYAYMDMGMLEQAHRITFKLDF
jgi:hypothetical protein